MPVRADRDRFIQCFFEEVPRPDLDEALTGIGDDRFRRLHDALHDDIYRKISPGTLCRKFGISWIDLMNLWHRHTIYSGRLAMMNHLPRILIDLAEDSESHDGPCPVCDGIGYVAIDSVRYTCVECGGVGRVRVPGDTHERRQLFEILGLIGPRKGRPVLT
jgi:hypothetical protein